MVRGYDYCFRLGSGLGRRGLRLVLRHTTGCHPAQLQAKNRVLIRINAWVDRSGGIEARRAIADLGRTQFGLGSGEGVSRTLRTPNQSSTTPNAQQPITSQHPYTITNHQPIPKCHKQSPANTHTQQPITSRHPNAINNHTHTHPSRANTQTQ